MPLISPTLAAILAATITSLADYERGYRESFALVASTKQCSLSTKPTRQQSDYEKGLTKGCRDASNLLTQEHIKRVKKELTLQLMKGKSK